MYERDGGAQGDECDDSITTAIAIAFTITITNTITVTVLIIVRNISEICREWSASVTRTPLPFPPKTAGPHFAFFFKAPLHKNDWVQRHVFVLTVDRSFQVECVAEATAKIEQLLVLQVMIRDWL